MAIAAISAVVIACVIHSLYYLWIERKDSQRLSRKIIDTLTCVQCHNCKVVRRTDGKWCHRCGRLKRDLKSP